MPLPTNGSFPVLGYSRPGEAVQSKPKRAIIVRMSPETLKALQDFPNNPPMEFQFGENPKIYIGDECFNLNPAPETTPHDLYLRASSATKKNPPFKLHANIIGKLTVQRELVAAVGEKVRGSATEAIAQRARTNVMTEDPKALITETKRQKEAARQLQKKKKSEGLTGIGASSRSNGSSLLDKAKNKAVASAERMGTAKIPSNPLDRLSPDRAQDIRRRLIHFAAQAERSEDEVVRAIGGSNPSPQSRQVICHILDEVAEQVGKPGSKYRLKAKSWKEVRPYEWDKWSDSERTRICREARVKLSKLGVSESDPLWAHFVYRRPNNGNGFAASPSHPSQSSSAQTAGRRGTPEPKRPLMTSDYREKEKEKAGASRVKAKGEIMAKDESRSASRNGRESPSEMSRVASSSSSTSRKQPGSGFKAPNSKLSNDITRDTTPSRKTEMRPPSTTGRDSPSASSVRSDTQVGRVPRRNRERAGSVHDSDTERRRTGQVHQGSKLVQRTKVEDDYQDSDVERRRQQRHADQEREREKEREREWEREKEKEREREREKEREWEWEQEEKEKLREKERRQREREQDRERERRERERERAKESDKERERNGRERRDRDRVRVNGRDRDAEQEKPSRVKELRREREEGEASDAGSASASKRKARAVDDDDDDYSPSKSSQKRRRTDQAPIGLPPKPKADPYPESRYERSYSRQSESAESKRIKREPSPIPSLSHRTSSSSHKRPRSPLPPAPNKRAAMSVPRDRDTDSRSGSLKPRKNYKQENSDMIYTDSSDSDTRSRHKEELPQSRTASTTQRRVADSIGKLPELPIHPTKLEPGSDRNTLTPLPSNGNGRIPSQNRISRPHERLASLQKEYSKKFYPYDEQWRNMDAQQRALKRMLKKFRSGVDSVSEDDDPLMESGDLERGVGKLRKMADELILLDKEIKTLKDICGARVLSD